MSVNAVSRRKALTSQSPGALRPAELIADNSWQLNRGRNVARLYMLIYAPVVQSKNVWNRGSSVGIVTRLRTGRPGNRGSVLLSITAPRPAPGATWPPMQWLLEAAVAWIWPRSWGRALVPPLLHAPSRRGNQTQDIIIIGGVGLSSLYYGHIWPIVPAPDDRWGWLWSSWWNEHWQGKPKYSEKTCPSATLSTTNPT
jgi:hypothetical protein